MRLLYIAFFFIFSATLQAQSIANLNYGTTLAIDEVDIEFVKLIEDSRCPKNVNCVRAGKAVVLINIYIHGTFVEEKRLEFYPSGFNIEATTTLFNDGGLRIIGLNLSPYPLAATKTSKEDYYLELAIN